MATISNNLNHTGRENTIFWMAEAARQSDIEAIDRLCAKRHFNANDAVIYEVGVDIDRYRYIRASLGFWQLDVVLTPSGETMTESVTR
jgi:hypothetical protein